MRISLSPGRGGGGTEPEEEAKEEEEEEEASASLTPGRSVQPPPSREKCAKTSFHPELYRRMMVEEELPEGDSSAWGGEAAAARSSATSASVFFFCCRCLFVVEVEVEVIDVREDRGHEKKEKLIKHFLFSLSLSFTRKYHAPSSATRARLFFSASARAVELSTARAARLDEESTIAEVFFDDVDGVALVLLLLGGAAAETTTIAALRGAVAFVAPLDEEKRGRIVDEKKKEEKKRSSINFSWKEKKRNKEKADAEKDCEKFLYFSRHFLFEISQRQKKLFFFSIPIPLSSVAFYPSKWRYGTA